jgi:hypothetical protein
MRNLFSVFYDSGAHVILNENSSDSQFFEVVPDSTYSALVEAVCKKSAGGK